MTVYTNMASDTHILAEIQDSFLSCSICYEPYNRPKALPCLHTFCEGCLRDYVTSRHGGTGSFPCPLCRQEIALPREGVSGLPDNHFIIGLSDTVTPYNVTGHVQTNVTRETTPLLNTSDVNVHDADASNRIIRRFGNFGSRPHEFVKPSGIAVSVFTDDVYVADSHLNRISVFSTSGEFRRCFSCNCSIRDIAVKRSGYLLVTVSKDGSSIVREYTTEGGQLGSFGTYFAHENPYGIALTSNDRPVITGLRQHCVHVLTTQYKRSLQFGFHGKGNSHFNIPYYVTTNSRDDIIVADCGNHRIKVHRSDGRYVTHFGTEGSKPGQLLYPMGVCVDKYDNVYVADANNYRVQMFTARGEYVGVVVKQTYEYGVDVKPVNVTFSQDNVLMVILRGAKFCQVHTYFWDTDKYVPVQEKTSLQKLICCV